MNAPSLEQLAAAALRHLAESGESIADAARTGEAGWRAEIASARGGNLQIDLAGPDIPQGVAEEIAPPGLIAEQRPWKGTYRLMVSDRLVVMDLYWSPGEPLRIMGFSRGDWESDLLEKTPA